MAATQTPQRLQLGRELRAWRERSRIPAADVAKALECSISKISKIEAGKASVHPLELRALLDMYEVPEDEAERVRAIAAVARQRAQYRVAPWLRAYMSLEPEAAEIKVFHIDLVPGMFQTEEYTRAVTTALGPDQPPADVDRLVAIRHDWQARLLGDHPPQLQVVMYEAALRSLVGGREVMREQLARLVELSELPTVSLRVLPFSSGAHGSMGTAFIILRLAPPISSEVVYTEDLWSADYLDKPAQVSVYSEVFDRLTGTALDEQGTRAAIEGVIRELS